MTIKLLEILSSDVLQTMCFARFVSPIKWYYPHS